MCIFRTRFINGGAYILFSYTQVCNGIIFSIFFFLYNFFAYPTPTETTAGIWVTARVAIVQCPWKYVHLAEGIIHIL